MDFTYNYGGSTSNTGRVLSRTDAVQPEHSAVYGYDSIYRLEQATSASSTWALGWTFDTWGNRLTQSSAGMVSGLGSQSWAYANNRISATNYTYDASGNQTQNGASPAGHTFAYNAENQQTSMDGGAATYAYDGDGRRLKKVTSTETTYTFYGPGGILCEFSTSTALSSATSASSTNKTLYRTSEKTGTAVLLFTTAGTVIENNRTLPYGEAWLADVASANDKKFTTYDRDKESGLDYAGRRYYSSTTARFVSVDPVEGRHWLPQHLNRYLYAANDPVNLADPSGAIISTVYTESPNPPVVVEYLYFYTFLPRQRTGDQFRLTNSERAEEMYVSVSGYLGEAAKLQNIFSQEQLGCISGIETGREWNQEIVAKNGRVGLFQFNERNWRESGTGIPWNNGKSAKDPLVAAQVALVMLTRKLGYDGTANPTEEAVRKAIDDFGEGDGRYGQAVMDCAKQLKAGNFGGAYGIMVGYANWRSGGRK